MDEAITHTTKIKRPASQGQESPNSGVGEQGTTSWGCVPFPEGAVTAPITGSLNGQSMHWHLCRSRRDCLFTDRMKEHAAGLGTQDRKRPGKSDGHEENTNHCKRSGHMNSKYPITPKFFCHLKRTAETQDKDTARLPWVFLQSCSWLRPEGVPRRPTINTYPCTLPVRPTLDKVREKCSLAPNLETNLNFKWNVGLDMQGGI